MVVDSSVWLEILTRGPLSQKCYRAIGGETLVIPSLVLFEVYKKIKLAVSEDVALEAIATLSRHEVVSLEREIAILAADLAIEHKLAMADAIVLAHAEYLHEPLLTLDNDFARIESAKVIR